MLHYTVIDLEASWHSQKYWWRFGKKQRKPFNMIVAIRKVMGYVKHWQHDRKISYDWNIIWLIIKVTDNPCKILEDMIKFL